MALKLYGHKMSLCTRRVLVVLAEKDVPFELQTVDFFHGEHKVSVIGRFYQDDWANQARNHRISTSSLSA